MGFVEYLILFSNSAKIVTVDYHLIQLSDHNYG